MRLQVQVILTTAVLFWNVYADETKVKSSTRIKEIAPVFRRNPYRSSTTTPTTTEVDVTTSEVIEAVDEEKPSLEDNEFYVGREHYYDNRIDIQKENDETEIEEEAKEDLKLAASDNTSDELVYDNDEYYYEEYADDDDHAAEYYLRQQRQRQQRLKRLQERRRAWLRSQREKYYKSLTRWRRPLPPAVKAVKNHKPYKRKRPSRPQRPSSKGTLKAEDNRRHYESHLNHASASQSKSESTSLMRSLLGVEPFCVHDDAQFSCTFTPYCWMKGGVAMSGCDSMLYSCCVSHTIARRQDTFVGTGRAQKRVAKEILHNEPECGITRHRQFAKRIIGGHKAKFAELPWQVHIRISSYQCGGVLLNHHYVATAAHCVHQAKLSQITVHLGEFDTKNTKKVFEPMDSQSFRVDHITLHPDFRYMLTQPDRFDIAVLKLDRPVEYQDNIIPICLPTAENELVGKIGVVAGWGKTDNSFGKTGTNILNKVLVPIIENERCRAWHRDKAIAVQLHEEMFCAGHKKGKHDACLGDSGGPLVINFDGRWTLIGITSAGFGCAVEKQPGIYHKVSKTAKWLSQIIHQDSPR